MTRVVFVALAFALMPVLTQAQTPPPPELQALGQMLSEAMQREASTLARAIAAERQVRELREQVARLTPPAAEK